MGGKIIKAGADGFRNPHASDRRPDSSRFAGHADAAEVNRGRAAAAHDAALLIETACITRDRAKGACSVSGLFSHRHQAGTLTSTGMILAQDGMPILPPISGQDRNPVLRSRPAAHALY